MTKKNKEKWIKALRSGKYRQGHDKLRSKKRTKTYYCALGVAYEIGIAKIFKNEQLLERKGFLSLSEQLAITYLNDSGCSFDIIANHIEVNY